MSQISSNIFPGKIDGDKVPTHKIALGDVRYHRVLTLKDLILLGLSMTIGSGIFILIDDVARYSRNLVWLSILLAGVMSLLTAMSYAELSGIFRNNHGEAGYIESVTNKNVSHVAGLLIMCSDIFILATISLGFGNYLSKMIGMESSSVSISLSIISVILLNYLNYLGIRSSVNVCQCALYIKLIAIVVLIIVCFTMGHLQENLLGTSSSNITVGGVTTGTLIGLFAYLGFNNLTNFSEETIDPEITVGQSIIYTVIIVIIIYTVIVIASLFVVNSLTLSQTNTPLATIMGHLFGHYGFYLFVLLGVISLFDTLLVNSISESRYIHALLSKMSPEYANYDMNIEKGTPYLSIIILVLLTVTVICVVNNIATTAFYGDFMMLIIFIIVNVVVIILRYQQPNIHRPFKVPFNWGKIPIPSMIAIIVGIYALVKTMSPHDHK